MVDKHIVSIACQEGGYSKDDCFRPSKKYPEYKWDEYSVKNETYDSVRQSFILQKWDEKNIGTKKWNPLGEFIEKDQVILVKPNLVMDYNKSNNPYETDCLYTHPDIVAAVVDYVALALDGTGKIIIADSPVQGCDFERLIKNSGYMRLVNYYKSKGIYIEIRDLRSTASDTNYKIIDLGSDSEHYKKNGDKLLHYRVTSYPPCETERHHSGERHEYAVSQTMLDCDVLINIPKPKTHRKAGMTGACKNLIGITSRKEFLPHHTKGALAENGDEYRDLNVFHAYRSKLLDEMNTGITGNRRLYFTLKRPLMKFLSLMIRFSSRSDYSEGSWYGNTTISKTIIDVNKITLYADKRGVMQDTPQRKMIIVGDMIISGEKEGPMAPSSKFVGMIVTATDPVIFDETVTTLMGFDVKKIPTIVNAREVREKYVISNTETAIISSNSNKYDGILLRNIKTEDILWFEPSEGWKNHIELDK